MSKVIELDPSQSVSGFARKFKVSKCHRCGRTIMYRFTEKLPHLSVKRRGQWWKVNRAVYHCADDICGAFLIAEITVKDTIQNMPLPFDE